MTESGAIRHFNQAARASGESSSDSSRPCELASASTAWPTSIMCGVFSMTSRATRVASTCRLRQQALPDRAGERMTQASSVTIPEASGNPPYPTESTCSSRSAVEQMTSQASRGSPPETRSPRAASMPRCAKDQVPSKRGLFTEGSSENLASHAMAERQGVRKVKCFV